MAHVSPTRRHYVLPTFRMRVGGWEEWRVFAGELMYGVEVGLSWELMVLGKAGDDQQGCQDRKILLMEVGFCSGPKH